VKTFQPRPSQRGGVFSWANGAASWGGGVAGWVIQDLKTMFKKQKLPELTGSILGIATAWQYWSEVAQPSVISYLELPTPRTAFGACMALWHLYDWVKSEQVTDHTEILSSPNIAVLRDVITWGKHRTVGHSMGQIQAVTEELDGMRLMMAPGFQPITEHLAKFSVVFKNGRVSKLEDVVLDAFRDWQTFFSNQ